MGTLAFILSTALLAGGIIMGFGTARRFVRERMRYVDGAHRPLIPLIVGAVAFLIAVPIVNVLSIIPLVHLGGVAALALGASVGLGVRAGTQDIRDGRHQLHS